MLRAAFACAFGVLLATTPAGAESDWLEKAFGGAPSSAGGTRTTSTGASIKSFRLFMLPLAPQKGPGSADDTPAQKAANSRDPPQTGEPAPVKPVNPNIGQHFSTPSKSLWHWTVTKAVWTAQNEAGFERFIAAIGESDCATVHDCLTDPRANPRHHTANPPEMTFAADCADLPYVLRGYFAWMNELPFSYSTVVAQRTAGNGVKAAGNQVTGRYDIIGPGPDPRQALSRIAQFVSSEHFRTPPSSQPTQPASGSSFLPDHYPVKITIDSIRPGTVIFDPDGHVAVVYKVSSDGRIHYIDAHPDNTLTRGVYGREFGRAMPEMGAGFKRWRPQVLKGATAGTDGTLSGGHIVLTPDKELADWSDEQFYGTKGPQFNVKGARRQRPWSAGTFEINGEVLDYYDFVRVRLAGPGFKYDPLEETRALVRGLCQDLKYRVFAVEAAIKAGMHLRPQPVRLPNNIYATDGVWELYSTPSRDARMKTGFEELYDEVERFLALRKASSSRLAYAGTDLGRDLLAVYRAEASACSISYVKSDGRSHQLGFETIRQRLFDLSFDPHHCVERRWGATPSSPGDELKSCADGAEKRAWYDAQARLRNQLVRTYGEKMGWSLAELQRSDLDIGMDERPDVDVVAMLTKPKSDIVAAVAKRRR